MHRLYREQFLPLSLEEAWSFFSNPANLSEITPPWLKFRITSELPERMYAGLIIQYRITVPPGVPVNWVTEIKHVREPNFFVDEQRLGPYRLWHHQHRFEPVEGGVRMEDIVHYQLPFEPLGSWLMHWWIRRKLDTIFDYRFQYLAEHAGDSRIHSESVNPTNARVVPIRKP
ncbi:MAG: SRPBCC family protein [Acidobacteriota bacterium]|nr:SRPBCC family protein [Acidobacteriota bacterium]